MKTSRRNRVLNLVLLFIFVCFAARNVSALQIELVRTTKGDSVINSVAFSPDGKMLASGTKDGIRLYDVPTEKLKSAWRWRKDRTRIVVFSPNGQLLASGGEDNLVRIWDVRTGRVTHVLRGHSAPLLSLVFSPDGSTLASGSASEDEEDSSSGELKVWNAQTGKLRRTLYKGSGVYPVVFSPDGKKLVAATGGLYQLCELTFYDTRTLKENRVLELPHGRDTSPQVGALMFRRNALIVVSQDDDSASTFRFFNARTGKLITILRDQKHFAYDVALSPDNRFLAVASSDNPSDEIQLRDTQGGRIVQTAKEQPRNVSSLAFSKNGLLAAGSQDGGLWLWRVK